MERGWVFLKLEDDLGAFLTCGPVDERAPLRWQASLGPAMAC